MTCDPNSLTRHPQLRLPISSNPNLIRPTGLTAATGGIQLYAATLIALKAFLCCGKSEHLMHRSCATAKDGTIAEFIAFLFVVIACRGPPAQGRSVLPLQTRPYR